MKARSGWGMPLFPLAVVTNYPQLSDLKQNTQTHDPESAFWAKIKMLGLRSLGACRGGFAFWPPIPRGHLHPLLVTPTSSCMRPHLSSILTSLTLLPPLFPYENPDHFLRPSLDGPR